SRDSSAPGAERWQRSPTSPEPRRASLGSPFPDPAAPALAGRIVRGALTVLACAFGVELRHYLAFGLELGPRVLPGQQTLELKPIVLSTRLLNASKLNQGLGEPETGKIRIGPSA